MIGILMLLGIFVGVAWVAGRRYERKQFVRVGKPVKTQEVLGVFKK